MHITKPSRYITYEERTSNARFSGGTREAFSSFSAISSIPSCRKKRLIGKNTLTEQEKKTWVAVN